MGLFEDTVKEMRLLGKLGRLEDGIKRYQGAYSPVNTPIQNPEHRYDSNDYKSHGYFGELPVPSSNSYATEYSISQDIDGSPISMPSLVPTLTNEEIQQVLHAAKNQQLPPQVVLDKALAHAQDRIKQGKSPFWAVPEKQYQHGVANGIR